MIKTLLIEDEPPALDALHALLRDHPEVEIVGEAGDFDQARAALQKQTYELVLLDIQLIGGNAFDLVPLVRPGAAIVFVTAYDQYAIRAFEVNALDFLLKPVAPGRLALSLQRVARQIAPAAGGGRLTTGDAVFLNDSHGSGRFVPVTAIVMIRSAENYTEVYLESGKCHLVRRTMKAWKEQLPGELFFRAHRLTIVNLAYVESVEHGGEENLALYIKGRTAPIYVSRRLWPELKKTLKQGRVPLAPAPVRGPGGVAVPQLTGRAQPKIAPKISV